MVDPCCGSINITTPPRDGTKRLAGQRHGAQHAIASTTETEGGELHGRVGRSFSPRRVFLEDKATPAGGQRGYVMVWA